ncbi:MAG: hypothetical protein K940chlam9_01378 [Chlamydiae bacterium]|nr:hypothetical protein [Chlamydiota bacterium]
MNKTARFFLILSLCISLSSCGLTAARIDPGKITSLNIIDRNGMSETIQSKDRLAAYEKTNFLSPQPYQKVMRVYGQEKNGDKRSCITSYHPNGQVKQSLEALNNRAYGNYQEWYQNGQIKIQAKVIGGIADLNTQAEESWLFDGSNKAWDEEGNLVARVQYSKGELQGESLYYHPNGNIWKQNWHEKNSLHGSQQVFLENGTLFQSREFRNGASEGVSIRYWSEGSIAYQEEYQQGSLQRAVYYDRSGELVSQIQEGRGFRAVFGKNELQELQEYKEGRQKGEVKVFDGTDLAQVYQIREGIKEGEEIDYFPGTKQPKLLVTWSEGILQGPMKSWYENGNLESQREISENKKNGLLTAWYRNGALMLVEEYDNDKLTKGEYYRNGEKAPISHVDQGKGIATLFNPEGNFSRKIHYYDGRPVE